MKTQEIYSTKKCGKPCGSKLKNVIFGLLVIAAGVLLIMKNMELLTPSLFKVIFSWPMLLIAVGFHNLFGRSSWIFGLILMSVGGFFILPNVLILPDNFTSTFWPLLVIIAGILIIFFSVKKFEKIGHIQKSQTDDYIDDVLVFSGSERIVVSDNFKGGKSVNVFGGSSYNLSQAKLGEGPHVLEVICVLGGTKIIVPRDWHIKMEVASVLGGFEDKRILTSDMKLGENTLIIKGVCVLGGGEIVNH